MSQRLFPAIVMIALSLGVLSCSTRATLTDKSAGIAATDDQADLQQIAAIPGANCTGSLGPDTDFSREKVHSTSYVCTVDGANDAVFRLTFTASWAFNAVTRAWEAADISVDSKNISQRVAQTK